MTYCDVPSDPQDSPASKPLSPRYTFYCDESGSTGVELWSEAQPFYVTGGVLLTEQGVQGVEALVADVLKRSGQAELKGKLAQRDPRELVGLLRKVEALGGEFFFVVAEKKFSIAMKIVDVLMDPAHNPSADWLPTSDDVERDRVAQALLGLPDATLKAFATAYREPSIKSWLPVVEKLDIQCQLMGWHELAKTFRGASQSISEIVKNEDGGHLRHMRNGPENIRHHQYASVLVPNFCHVVRLVDRALEQRKQTGRVVHDLIPKFQNIYAWYFDSFLKKLDGSSLPVTSGRYFRKGVTNLDSLAFEDSENCAGIQVADILCTGVRLAFQSKDDSPAQLETLPLLEPLFYDKPTAGVTLTPETHRRVSLAWKRLGLA